MRFKLHAAVLLLAAAPAARALEEVPFVVTPDSVTLTMLQIAKVLPEDYVMDLGSGDGRIVILAAKRFGARGMGIEIRDDLIEKSRAAATAAGVSGRAAFRNQDLFKTDLSPASVVTLYLLPDVNMQLRPKLLALRPGTRVVSHDFDMGDWEADKVVAVDAPDKPIGLEKKSKVYLWVVPARVEGRWCAQGKHKGQSIDITQRYQHVRVDVPQEGSVRALEGKVDGYVIRTRSGALNLVFEANRLKATYASGATAALKGATFVRPRGQSCG
jgi:SAM-dependent methyltransferase